MLLLSHATIAEDRGTTTLQVNGVSTENPYLARVQQSISAQWIAPPVNLTQQPIRVVVGFRFHKSGGVSNIVIEGTSGNDYYGLAAIRAVYAAKPLLSFPPEMSQQYLDARFTFETGNVSVLEKEAERAEREKSARQENEERQAKGDAELQALKERQEGRGGQTKIGKKLKSRRIVYT